MTFFIKIRLKSKCSLWKRMKKLALLAVLWKLLVKMLLDWAKGTMLELIKKLVKISLGVGVFHNACH